ncbi:MAG: hypothetical protein ACRD1K_18985 [Acidimicrobiales bacterium]
MRPAGSTERSGSGAFARVGGIVVFVVSGFLLTSMGGAGIAASPVTLPLMYLVVRGRPTKAFRNAAVVIGGLTALEAGWGLSYLAFGGAGRNEAATIVVGVACMVVAVIAFWRMPTQ